jgi:membrane protease YdiL (CAAX protease family)
MLSFGPIIAAFVVSAFAGGRSHVSLVRALVRWRVHWLWYAFALAGPFFIAGLAAAVATALGILDASNLADDFGWSAWATLPLLFVSTTLVGGALFEEPGWRGLLLPKLQDHHPALWSTAVVGTIWAMWHLPLLVSEPTGQRPPLPFIVWILAQAVLYTWLYNGSAGSVLLVILLHGAANSANRILLEPFVGEDRFIALWWTVAALYSLAAGMAVWWTRGRLGYGTVGNPAQRSKP